jgi:hypothetical protein
MENHPFKKAERANAANGLERVRLALKFGLNTNLENAQSYALSKLALSMVSNPRFLAEQIKSNQETAGMLAPMIEEGMADGSIRPGNPKVMADLLMLLLNFWVFPSIFPCDREELMAKVLTIQQAFDGLGCPAVNEEIAEIFTKVADALDW